MKAEAVWRPSDVLITLPHGSTPARRKRCGRLGRTLLLGRTGVPCFEAIYISRTIAALVPEEIQPRW